MLAQDYISEISAIPRFFRIEQRRTLVLAKGKFEDEYTLAHIGHSAAFLDDLKQIKRRTYRRRLVASKRESGAPERHGNGTGVTLIYWELGVGSGAPTTSVWRSKVLPLLRDFCHFLRKNA